jgi:alkylation response protein AidB-like acyl-CoA dehydrogenase
MTTTAETVGAISSGDVAALESAGIPQLPTRREELRRQLLDAIARIRPILEADAEANDAAETLAWPSVVALYREGLLSLKVPRELGGPEVAPHLYLELCDELSYINPSAGWCAFINSTSAALLGAFLPDTGAERVFPSGRMPIASGALIPRGVATPVDGGWRVSGQWPFASGCHQATWMPTAAWLHDESGPIRDVNGAPEWRVFHLPASECVILDTWHTSGLRGTGSADYTIDYVFVPGNYVKKHSLLEEVVLPDRRYVYPAFNVPMLSAVALGAARGAVDALAELFGGKVDRRNQRPVAAAFDKQADLGIATATVDSARAYLYDTTARAWELTVAGEELPRELRAAMRLACTHAVQSSVDAADRAHRAAGSSSIYNSSPIDRFFRDAHAVAAHAFVRQTTMADGGQLLLGQEPAFRVF